HGSLYIRRQSSKISCGMWPVKNVAWEGRVHDDGATARSKHTPRRAHSCKRGGVWRGDPYKLIDWARTVSSTNRSTFGDVAARGGRAARALRSANTAPR